MVSIDHRLGQILVDKLPHESPSCISIHPQQVVAFSDDLLADFVRWSIAGHRTSLIKKLLRNPTISDNNRGCWTQFETEDASILLCLRATSPKYQLLCSVFC
jgi:hypothetical protein